MQTPRPTIGIIGAGRVGAPLGASLARAGYRIVAASGGSDRSAGRIAALLPGVPRRRPVEVAAAAELVLLAVPDDVLAPLAARLARSGAAGPGQTLAHTSGAYGTGVLAPAVARGARPLALHPAMTFTGTAADLEHLAGGGRGEAAAGARPAAEGRGISFGVTAPRDVRPLARRLVADLGGTVEWIDEQRRALYHAALAHGANHLVTLANEAVDRLREAGVADPAAVLRPLLCTALENALRLGDAALTGPVSRGDAGTVARHLDALAAAAPDAVPAYRALARRTADRAIAAGRLAPHSAGALLGVLADREWEGVG
jgi:predicted short-subunit dehydrogenase-like oxidoreductase (DUF2520 family)